jgi:hypothetical protein
MKTVAALVVTGLLLIPGVALAGPATDAALGLGAFAVFNQIVSGTGVFAGIASRPVVVAAPPVVVAPAPPIYVAPPPPVYVAPPAPVYVAPRPVVIAPAPVFVRPVPVFVRPVPPHAFHRVHGHRGQHWGWDHRRF